jgi:hypothetical protein
MKINFCLEIKINLFDELHMTLIYILDGNKIVYQIINSEKKTRAEHKARQEMFRAQTR